MLQTALTATLAPAGTSFEAPSGRLRTRSVDVGMLCECAHYLRLSTAIRTARPARTVPISQRWISAHEGCAFKNPAIDPAIMAMAALTVTLTTICVDPSASDCRSTLPACKSMNWGSDDKYSIAIFGLIQKNVS